MHDEPREPSDAPQRPREPRQPEPERGNERDPDKVIPADQTAPGLGDVEIGGESLDP